MQHYSYNGHALLEQLAFFYKNLTIQITYSTPN